MLVSWVVEEDFFSESSRVEVEVNFGSSDSFVSEHLLNCAEVSAAFEEVGCERMPEGVRGDSLFNSGSVGEPTYEDENHLSRESCATSAEKQEVFFSMFNGDIATLG